MDGVTEGRMVHYVLREGNNPGAHRPALIVNAWNSIQQYQEEGRVNLHVFPDFGNDGAMYNSGSYWATSVPYDGDTKAKGTWHWIEKVEPEKTEQPPITKSTYFEPEAPKHGITDAGIEQLAKQAYHAYGSVTDFKNYQGNPMPLWEDLTDTIRAAWRAAARFGWNEGYNWELMHKSK